MLRLTRAHPRTPAQQDGLACRHKHFKKRNKKLLIISCEPLYLVTTIQVLYTILLNENQIK
jgi:hypothetical protein